MRELRDGQLRDRMPVVPEQVNGEASADVHRGARHIRGDTAGTQPPDHPRPPEPRTPDSRGAAAARDWLDTPAGGRPGDGTFREALGRFEAARAGLPGVAGKDAGDYLAARSGDRPWLSPARRCVPAVQRVFAALDLGGEHAHIRHEGWLSPDKSQQRVQRLEDPAQLDAAKRAAGIDGLRPGGKPHYCAAMSTAIRDPSAFAVAFARGVEHPAVRAVLDQRPQPGERKPDAVRAPITSILGADGHTFCEGFRLAGDNPKQAASERGAWLRDTRAGKPSAVPPPLVVPVDFRGGFIEYPFRVAGDRYQVASMYPVPFNPRDKA